VIRNILPVTRVFPPSADPELVCTGKLAVALGDGGVQVVIVTLAGNEAKRPDDAAHLSHRNAPVVRKPRSADRGVLRVLSYFRSWWAVRTSVVDAFSVQALAEDVKVCLRERHFDLIYPRGLAAADFVAGCLAAASSGIPYSVFSHTAPLPQMFSREVRTLSNEARVEAGKGFAGKR
jgi:hypothetical protein